MTWHWIITLQWVTGRGETAVCTAHGNISSQQAAGTRSAAYEAIVNFVEPPADVSPETRPMVLFFSLEPDSLVPAPEPAHVGGGAS